MRINIPTRAVVSHYPSRIGTHIRLACRIETSSIEDRRISVMSALIAAAAMGIPMMIAELRGHLGVGLVMALGALSATRTAPLASIAERQAAARQAFLPTSLAAAVAALLSRIDYAELVMVTVVSLCALLIRYSRPVAVATVRFILFLVIFSTAIGASQTPWRLAFLVTVGAFWTAALIFILSFVTTRPPIASIRTTEASMHQRLNRMRRELSAGSTWDYPARLFIGLALSFVVRQLCPTHHYSWITVAVALLTPRKFEMWPLRASQRLIGTVAGVLAAGLLLILNQGSPIQVVAITVLAGLRSWYEERSYLLYTAVMTPLILCLLGGGQGTSFHLLVDRITATLVGVQLVWLSNWIASNSTARATIHAGLAAADRPAVS